MNRRDTELLLARIEGLKAFLENNSLESFQHVSRKKKIPLWQKKNPTKV